MNVRIAERRALLQLLVRLGRRPGPDWVRRRVQMALLALRIEPIEQHDLNGNLRRRLPDWIKMKTRS
jgi:hypothetical protein